MRWQLEKQNLMEDDFSTQLTQFIKDSDMGSQITEAAREIKAWAQQWGL